jgi:hypothetical protein
MLLYHSQNHLRGVKIDSGVWNRIDNALASASERCREVQEVISRRIFSSSANESSAIVSCHNLSDISRPLEVYMIGAKLGY